MGWEGKERKGKGKGKGKKGKERERKERERKGKKGKGNHLPNHLYVDYNALTITGDSLLDDLFASYALETQCFASG